MQKFVLSAIVAAFALTTVNAGEKTQAPAKAPAKEQAPAKGSDGVKTEKGLVPLSKTEKKNLELYKEVDIIVVPCTDCNNTRRGLFGRKKQPVVLVK